MNEAQRNVEIMKGWYQVVWNERNSAYIDEHYAADGKAYGLGDSYLEGPAAFKGFHQAMLTKFPDMHVELVHCIGQGDLVALEFHATMTHNGKPITLRGGGFTRLKDGKIIEAWNHVDFLELLEQMGAAPAGSLQAMLES